MAYELGLGYYETSAATNAGVEARSSISLGNSISATSPPWPAPRTCQATR